jgi:CRP/FNR family cyclic AMP-dependent transcriptional regulator
MDTLERILAEQPLFEGLEAQYLALITGCASNARFKEGEFIAHENDDADHFYIVRHGRVAIDMFVPEQGPVTIQTIQDGDVVGWAWIIPPYKWHFDVRAVMLTRALRFDGACIRKKCAEDPRLGYELMQRFAQVFARRLHATRLQLLDVYGQTK